jgi:hypothetical protein
VTAHPNVDEPEVRDLLRTAWAAQLGTSDFADNDPFFVVGGDSLKAVKAMKEVSRAVGSKLSVRLLFDHQSIDELGPAICAQLRADAVPASSDAVPTSTPRAADQPVPDDWHGTAPAPMDPDTVFNGFVAANVVFSLDQLGLLDRLAVEPIPLALLETEYGRAGLELVRVAASMGYLTRGDGSVALTPAGHEMHRMRGYFTWSVGGYHDVFRNAADIIAGHRSFGAAVRRDEAMVATGSGQNGARLMGHILDDAIDGLEFGHIADLGSGDGSRLRQILSRREGASATGYDISGPATALARKGFANHGLVDRAEAVEADVLGLIHGEVRDERAAEVDAVVSVFLMHDLLADPARRTSVLPGLRTAFPAARTFLVADTMLRPGPEEPDRLPVFATGYELAHALMGVPLHTTDTYEELFAAAGMRPRQVLPFGTPHSWLYVLDAD